MMHFAHLLEGRSKPILKKALRLRFVATKPVGAGDQLPVLWGEHRTEQTRIDRFKAAAQPYVKKIREIRVADVVVVGRVCAYKRFRDGVHRGGGIQLKSKTHLPGRGYPLQTFGSPL